MRATTSRPVGTDLHEIAVEGIAAGRIAKRGEHNFDAYDLTGRRIAEGCLSWGTAELAVVMGGSAPVPSFVREAGTARTMPQALGLTPVGEPDNDADTDERQARGEAAAARGEFGLTSEEVFGSPIYGALTDATRHAIARNAADTRRNLMTATYEGCRRRVEQLERDLATAREELRLAGDRLQHADAVADAVS